MEAQKIANSQGSTVQKEQQFLTFNYITEPQQLKKKKQHGTGTKAYMKTSGTE
jgi:hypothetical protein